VLAAKAIIEVYYGRRPRYSYFSGCSAGGRGAFNAAANYGEEYDGVVAGAPTRNMSGMVSRWAQAGQLMAPSPAKLASLYQAQLAQCDGGDGLIDGVIGNAAACRFDVSTLRCPAGVDGDSCLTDVEIEVVENLRNDLTLANGRVVYSRYGLGNPGPDSASSR